jgi:hypothetical protein
MPLSFHEKSLPGVITHIATSQNCSSYNLHYTISEERLSILPSSREVQPSTCNIEAKGLQATQQYRAGCFLRSQQSLSQSRNFPNLMISEGSLLVRNSRPPKLTVERSAQHSCFVHVRSQVKMSAGRSAVLALFLSLSRRMPGEYIKLGQGHVIPYPFQIVIRKSSRLSNLHVQSNLLKASLNKRGVKSKRHCP